MRLHRVTRSVPLRLGDTDALWREEMPESKALKKSTAKFREQIGDLQARLYADGRYALLVVLQGRDASGKDGTIRKVFSEVDPQGCEVTSWKVPTELERKHDFLWRIHHRVPPRGMIGVFNRSHYEDVLVPRVKFGMTEGQAVERLQQINEFERMLAANRVVILKFALHISRTEQRARLQDRLEDPTKNWKFNPGDLDDRKLWDDYTRAYRLCLSRTSTSWAPWHVVPADDKDVRNHLIARKVAEVMGRLKLKYPRASTQVLAMRVPK